MWQNLEPLTSWALKPFLVLGLVMSLVLEMSISLSHVYIFNIAPNAARNVARNPSRKGFGAVLRSTLTKRSNEFLKLPMAVSTHAI